MNVEPRVLRACDYTVGPDASAASYPITLAAMHGGRATVALGSSSMQGDAHFAQVLGRMGARVSQSSDRTTVEGRAATPGSGGGRS